MVEQAAAVVKATEQVDVVVEKDNTRPEQAKLRRVAYARHSTTTYSIMDIRQQAIPIEMDNAEKTAYNNEW